LKKSVVSSEPLPLSALAYVVYYSGNSWADSPELISPG
jgi:hypothetical protein